jgi:tetrahydromethanopterin S-methyltransferase subunit G
MNSDDKLFELIGQIYSEMRDGFASVNQRLDRVEGRLDNVEKTALIIEQEHGRKLDALFDGYKQNTEKLDRIETEMVKHEEFIIKRIK